MLDMVRFTDSDSWGDAMNFHTLYSAIAFTAMSGAATVACKNDAPSVAQAYVEATLNGAQGSQYLGECEVQSSTTWLSIGADPGAPKLPATVEDGSGSAHISCTVNQTGMDQYSLSLSAEVEGMMGGTLTITSDPGTPITSMGGTNLSMDSSISNQGFGHLKATGCTLDFSVGRASGGVNIAPGRVWGRVSCPVAMDISGLDKMGPDGGPTPVTCATFATFLFQACSGG
jgi:hypothetical protein